MGGPVRSWGIWGKIQNSPPLGGANLGEEIFSSLRKPRGGTWSLRESVGNVQAIPTRQRDVKKKHGRGKIKGGSQICGRRQKDENTGRENSGRSR